MTTPETEELDPFEGLTAVAGGELERIAIRLRESAVTLSAWRIPLVAAEGAGVIVLVETPGGGALFRGDGVCLGWPQQRLEAAYRRLLPGGGDREPETVQGG